MATPGVVVPRLRDYPRPDGKGDWDFAAIFQKEIYPAIKAIRSSLTEITNNLNRFTPRFVTGASNPILTTDEMALIVVDHGSSCELTFDAATAATFTAGTQIAMMQYGAGQLTLNPTGVTVQRAETIKTRKQYCLIIITMLRDLEWVGAGDVELA